MKSHARAVALSNIADGVRTDMRKVQPGKSS